MARFASICLLLLTTSCTGFLYQPTPYFYSDPKEVKLNPQEIRLKGSDGFELVGWYFKSSGQKASKNKALVLFFHGNAQNITSHYMNLAWLPERGHDYLIFDYRGYGISEGSPQPKGLYTDAIDFLEYAYKLYKNEGYKKFVVYGQSLGGAVLQRAVVDFKHKNEIDLMVIDSSFLSYSDIAFDKLKGNSITFLLSPLAYLLIQDDYAPALTVNRYDLPTLVIHGDDDHIIPYKFGQELFKKLPSKNKIFWQVEGGHHIDIFFSAKANLWKERFVKLIENGIN